MSGLFARWQPRYAEHNLATFPVRIEGADKRPAVRGYLKLGLDVSRQLARRFPANDAFGFALGNRTRITVLDVDTPDERVRDDAFARHGEPFIVVRTLQGRWQGWYRHNGEQRRIRPWPGKPIDVLGGGFVCAPPSQGPRSSYAFVQGGLDDLDRLTQLRALADLPADGSGRIPEGRRDDTLFRLLLREVKACDDFDTLLDVARTINMSCVPPLPDAQVVSKAKQAWSYEISGSNWVGHRARASTTRTEILALSHAPAAAMLLNLLRVSHPQPDARFAIDQVQTAQLLGWNRKTLGAAIQILIDARRLNRVRRGGRGDHHVYELRR